MATYDEFRNSAQSAFQPGQANASRAPLTAPGAVTRAAFQRPASALPGGGGQPANPAQGPQPGMVTPAGVNLPGGTPGIQPGAPGADAPQAFGGMSPVLAQLLQKDQGSPLAGTDVGGGPSTLPSNMPSIGAFGRSGMNPGQTFGGTSGFGAKVGPFRSGGTGMGGGGAFGRA